MQKLLISQDIKCNGNRALVGRFQHVYEGFIFLLLDLVWYVLMPIFDCNPLHLSFNAS